MVALPRPPVPGLPVPLPGVDALVEERTALMATLRGLDRDDLVDGPSLCEGWSPRDVLAHLVGTADRFGDYVRARGSISGGNALSVAAGRELDVDELLDQGDTFATAPTLPHRLSALLWLGDTAVHHLDVLRPRGMTRELPDASASAVVREGLVLGGRRLASVRVVPTDGGRALGRGREVRGPRVSLGMWLAGRDAFAEDLTGV